MGAIFQKTEKFSDLIHRNPDKLTNGNVVKLTLRTSLRVRHFLFVLSRVLLGVFNVTGWSRKNMTTAQTKPTVPTVQNGAPKPPML